MAAPRRGPAPVPRVQQWEPQQASLFPKVTAGDSCYSHLMLGQGLQTQWGARIWTTGGPVSLRHTHMRTHTPQTYSSVPQMPSFCPFSSGSPMSVPGARCLSAAMSPPQPRWDLPCLPSSPGEEKENSSHVPRDPDLWAPLSSGLHAPQPGPGSWDRGLPHALFSSALSEAVTLGATPWRQPLSPRVPWPSVQLPSVLTGT